MYGNGLTAVGLLAPNVSPVSILIIEDDPSIATFLASICKHRGWDCHTVSDGNAAMSLLRRHHYQAVVLDLMMPRSNGFEVIAYLRAEQPEMLHRVIVITAASAKTLESFDEKQVGALLHKPFELGDLQEALDKAVSIEE